jgi:hypothetical protein
VAWRPGSVRQGLDSARAGCGQAAQRNQNKMHVGVGIDMFGICVQVARERVSGFVGVSTLLSLLSVLPHQKRMRAQCERFRSGQWLTMQRMMLYRRVHRLHLVGRAVTGTCFTFSLSVIRW